MLAGGFPFSLSLPFSQCVVPPNLTGPVAIYVTNDTQPLINNPRDRFIGNIVAGPTMAFIDNSPQDLSSLAITGSASNISSSGSDSGSSDSGSTTVDSGSSTISTSISTSTISPDDASSILASASATASADGSTPTSAEDNSGDIPATANTTIGPSSDGSITVDGWQEVPDSK